jgi:hypothetical protein
LSWSWSCSVPYLTKVADQACRMGSKINRPDRGPFRLFAHDDVCARPGARMSGRSKVAATQGGRYRSCLQIRRMRIGCRDCAPSVARRGSVRDHHRATTRIRDKKRPPGADGLTRSATRLGAAH